MDISSQFACAVVFASGQRCRKLYSMWSTCVIVVTFKHIVDTKSSQGLERKSSSNKPSGENDGLILVVMSISGIEVDIVGLATAGPSRKEENVLFM